MTHYLGLRPDGLERERRRSARLETHVSAKYHPLSDRQEWYRGKTIDCSGAGVRVILSSFHAKPGTWIEVLLHLVGPQKTIRCKGRVVWSRLLSQLESRHVCGIAFENPRKSSYRDRFIAFLDQLDL